MIQLSSLLTSEQTLTIVSAFIVLFIPQLRKIFFSSKILDKEVSIKERIIFFDVVKGIAIIAVVLIHTLLLYKLTDKGNVTFIYMVNNIIRFAVPFFLIISGILLNPKNVENKNKIFRFYIKKIISIVIPYLILTLIISLYSKSDIKEFFYYAFTGKALGPYYYVVVLMQLYMLYPILVTVRKKNWILPAAFIISVVTYLFEFTWHIYDVTLCLPYLYFFVYGIVNREYYLNTNYKRKDVRILLAVIIGYLIFSFIWTDYYYNTAYLYGITLWNLFFIYKDILKNFWVTKWIAGIGRISLWIYLIHFPIVLVAYRLFSTISNVMIQMIVTCIISVLISFFIAKLLHMIYSGFWNKYTTNL